MLWQRHCAQGHACLRQADALSTQASCLPQCSNGRQPTTPQGLRATKAVAHSTVAEMPSKGKLGEEGGLVVVFAACPAASKCIRAAVLSPKLMAACTRGWKLSQLPEPWK